MASLFTNSSFKSARLSDCNLDGCGLQNAVFDHATLVRITSTGADSTTASFVNAKISHSHLKTCTLELVKGSGLDADASIIENCSMKRSALDHSKWADCTLVSVDLTGANLEGADFSGATFDRVDLTSCRYDSSTRWPKGIEAPIRIAFGPNCEVKNIRQPMFDLSLRDLNKSSIVDCTLIGATFLHSNLTSSIVQNSRLDKADFLKANLRGCRFSDVSLCDARFIDADLTGISFERCDLSGAVYNDGTRFPDDFHPRSQGMQPLKKIGKPKKGTSQ